MKWADDTGLPAIIVCGVVDIITGVPPWTYVQGLAALFITTKFHGNNPTDNIQDFIQETGIKGASDAVVRAAELDILRSIQWSVPRRNAVVIADELLEEHPTAKVPPELLEEAIISTVARAGGTASALECAVIAVAGALMAMKKGEEAVKWVEAVAHAQHGIIRADLARHYLRLR